MPCPYGFGMPNPDGAEPIRGLTHAQVARLAGTSRTRVTALVNRNAQDT